MGEILIFLLEMERKNSEVLYLSQALLLVLQFMEETLILLQEMVLVVVVIFSSLVETVATMTSPLVTSDQWVVIFSSMVVQDLLQINLVELYSRTETISFLMLFLFSSRLLITMIICLL